jgi:hypothetical protein
MVTYVFKMLPFARGNLANSLGWAVTFALVKMPTQRAALIQVRWRKCPKWMPFACLQPLSFVTSGARRCLTSARTAVRFETSPKSRILPFFASPVYIELASSTAEKARRKRQGSHVLLLGKGGKKYVE